MTDNIRTRFYAALCDMENPVKDSENPHFKSSYASLGAVLSTVKPCLQKHGLMLQQRVEYVLDGAWALSTYIIDATGDKMQVDSRPFSFSGTPQQNGSEETYLRRYALMCCMGLSAEDDDGNAAETRKKEKEADLLAKLRKVYRVWRDRNGYTDEQAQSLCLDWIGKPISKDLTVSEINTLLDYMNRRQ